MSTGADAALRMKMEQLRYYNRRDALIKGSLRRKEAPQERGDKHGRVHTLIVICGQSISCILHVFASLPLNRGKVILVEGSK